MERAAAALCRGEARLALSLPPPRVLLVRACWGGGGAFAFPLAGARVAAAPWQRSGWGRVRTNMQTLMTLLLGLQRARRSPPGRACALAPSPRAGAAKRVRENRRWLLAPSTPSNRRRWNPGAQRSLKPAPRRHIQYVVVENARRLNSAACNPSRRKDTPRCANGAVGSKRGRGRAARGRAAGFAEGRVGGQLIEPLSCSRTSGLRTARRAGFARGRSQGSSKLSRWRPSLRARPST